MSRFRTALRIGIWLTLAVLLLYGCAVANYVHPPPSV